MDAFLTAGERALKERVDDYFRGVGGPAAGNAPSRREASDPRDLLATLSAQSPPGAGAGVRQSLFEAALVVEEVSSFSPRLGLALLAARPGPDGWGSGGESAGEVAWTVGSTAAILDACRQAARERGLFESTLMGHQETQVELADILAGMEEARLGAYRALRLIDGGEEERGARELGLVRVRAGRVHRAARRLATGLLGPGWLAERVPNDERSGR